MRKLCLALSFFLCPMAQAQEAVTIPDMMDGRWVALHHSSDGGAHTDACILNASGLKIQFRADMHGMEIRTSPQDAAFSKGQSVSTTLSAGSFSRTLKMTALDGTTLSAPLTPTAMSAVLDAFTRTPSATLETAGSPDEAVSLAGSPRPVDVFKTCVTARKFAVVGSPSNKTH
ncbi:hypothetical protein [Acetobacter conturbans]|uniref:Uncharacterized protein n=1 Tax=Acetobacter conturbans TaxID=1737472 RepID=A0ABX0JY29_9PROT|nr:hypothetical protein [Acetobacter conturbans]NHN88211.1 hypothetical protein [Acetobacter conturbans]